MKAIIENVPRLDDHTKDTAMLREFRFILNHINNSETENDLRLILKEYNPDPIYFKYGFGHNHFWVHQYNIISGVISKDRIIFVEF